MKSLLKSYLFTFATLHIVSAITGNYIQELGRPLSTFLLIIVGGIITALPVWVENKTLCRVLSVGYAIAWVTEWFMIITWYPTWEPIQYYLISFLNLAASISYAYLGEIWNG